MNKHCFRLIFSKPLGFFIPVAEITRAKRKPGQRQGPAASAVAPKPPAFSIKHLALSMWVAAVPSWATAEILLDRSTGATVSSAVNGVPVIEIANPNGNGLSHNRFGQFDVANPGVIFNNSMVNGTSQIGGAVLLNPNLKQTAKAILTEITGNRPSSISGTLEVFGDAADLLIANRIKPDGNEIAAGTLGLFGLDHLKTSVSNQGILNPALQELLNVPEDRVHQIMPMFTDLQSGKEYFPSLTQPKASHAGASIAHPFKFVPEHDQPNNSQGIYQERKNRSHVIVNLVGDKAAAEVTQIQAAHPSSSITFAGDSKGLHYESGIAPNFRSDIPTKVYLLLDPAKPTLSTDVVLSQLGKMLGRDENSFKVKEGSLDSGADTHL